jgi:hypothetical protein
MDDAPRVEPVEPAWEQRFGRPQWRVAVPLAVLGAIVAWVGAAQVGGSGRPEAQPAAIAAGSTEPGTGPAATPVPSSPPVEHEGKPVVGTVLLRGDAHRTLDLATGRLGRGIGPDDLSSHLVLWPGGGGLCLCASWDGSPAGTVTYDLVLRSIDDAGRLRDGGTRLGRWTAMENAAVPDSERGDAAWSVAATSPDQRFVAIGLTLRRPPSWERRLLLVDLRVARIVSDVALEPAPVEDDGVEIHAWAPTPVFAPDGRHVLVTAGVLWTDQFVEQPTWIAPVVDAGLGGLRRLEGLGEGACLDAGAAFATDRIVYALCGRTIERRALDGTSLSPIDLTAALLPGVWPNHLVDPVRGRLWLWEPFRKHALTVDLRNGELLGSTVFDDDTARHGPVDAVARALSDWLAPPAFAKYVLEPALARSHNGARLYAVALVAGNESASEILVLDPDGLELLDRWRLPGNVSSIVARDDGTVLAAVTPDPARGASLVAIDGATGAVRTRIEGLGEYALTIVEADWSE